MDNLTKIILIAVVAFLLLGCTCKCNGLEGFGKIKKAKKNLKKAEKNRDKQFKRLVKIEDKADRKGWTKKLMKKDHKIGKKYDKAIDQVDVAMLKVNKAETKAHNKLRREVCNHDSAAPMIFTSFENCYNATARNTISDLKRMKASIKKKKEWSKNSVWKKGSGKKKKDVK